MTRGKGSTAEEKVWVGAHHDRALESAVRELPARPCDPFGFSLHVMQAVEFLEKVVRTQPKYVFLSSSLPCSDGMPGVA
jgi:hypothetical protein